jgi:hypothetical protein
MVLTHPKLGYEREGTMKTLSQHSSDVAQRAVARNTDQTGWARGNFTAATFPSTEHEQAIVTLCDGLCRYIHAQPDMDYVLGEGLAQIIEGIRVLLNGDLGRLDGGTVDAWLCYAAEEIGWDLDLSEWKAGNP